jgi:hypothetical protein
MPPPQRRIAAHAAANTSHFRRSPPHLVRLHDFGGHSLHTLLQSARAGSSSISDVLPSLHAIATTRVCIDLERPRIKEFFWRGKSDGKWKSHELFRAHGSGRSTSTGMGQQRHANAGMDPCVLLGRTSLRIPPASSNITQAQLRQVADLLNVPPKAQKNMTQAKLREKLTSAIKPAPASAYYLLRRRLNGLRGSTLELGDRHSLDVNVDSCPKKRALVGCRGHEYSVPFLGAFAPSAGGPGGSAVADPRLAEQRAEWTDRIDAAPPFKYCRTTGAGVAELPSQRVPGVAVLLPELHANLNVGHAAKDLVFLAHLLVEQHAARHTNRSFSISTVLIDDRASATGNMSLQQGFWYRRASIEALLANSRPRVDVVYMQEGAHRHRVDFGVETSQWNGSRSVCFDAVVQKGLAYAGDWRGADLFRSRVYASCSIPPDAHADVALVVVHGTATSGHTTRRWADQKALIESVRARLYTVGACSIAPELRPNATTSSGGPPGCRPLRVLVKSMAGLDFCAQAALYARSRVVFVHHGASLANGLFLRGSSLMVELNRPWANAAPGERGPRFTHTFDGAGYAGMFLSSGVAYIGARVTYGVWPPRTINSGRPSKDGTVRWSLRERVPYDFNEPAMEIGINASRWSDVLDEVESILARPSQAPTGAQLGVLPAPAAPSLPPAPEAAASSWLGRTFG